MRRRNRLEDADALERKVLSELNPPFTDEEVKAFPHDVVKGMVSLSVNLKPIFKTGVESRVEQLKALGYSVVMGSGSEHGLDDKRKTT